MSRSGGRSDDEQVIVRQKHRYCHTVDSGEYSAWVDLFTEDGVFHQVGEDPVEGKAALKEMMIEEFDTAFRHTAHLVSNPLVDVDAERATGRWYIVFAYESTNGVVGWNQGRYEDTLRLVDGDWRFEEVTVEFDISWKTAR